MGKKKPKKISFFEWLKAIRKGSREAELENSTGFNRKLKIHKNKKKYHRKTKHRRELLEE